ncbi:MAG: dephospho-CoA kinase [Gammaproteobacteria bacterium]|nr:dephospho-CoA kinase [Gammaproteobacteria bacterium]
MLVIGLTGGIASGKTTISDLFSALNVPVIDTDIISRRLLDPGQPGYENIIARFGNSILLKDKSMNRRMLRQMVFNDTNLKSWLESLLHPLIYQSVEQCINEHHKASYVLVVVPLLFESNFNSLIDRILVVDCLRDTQLGRLMARDEINEVLAIKMLDQQCSNKARLDQADEVIRNNDDDNLTAQVQRLHQQYLSADKATD